MSSTAERPEQIQLTSNQALLLKDRILNTSLSDADKKLLSGLVSMNVWLQTQLERAKLNIHSLKKLFGIKTEKQE